jgi:hypothetical protein
MLLALAHKMYLKHFCKPVAADTYEQEDTKSKQKNSSSKLNSDT